MLTQAMDAVKGGRAQATSRYLPASRSLFAIGWCFTVEMPNRLRSRNATIATGRSWRSRPTHRSQLGQAGLSPQPATVRRTTDVGTTIGGRQPLSAIITFLLSLEIAITDNNHEPMPIAFRQTKRSRCADKSTAKNRRANARHTLD